MNKAILVVEDDDSDLLFIQMALEGAGVKNSIAVARDGQEALDYLNGEARYVDRRQFPVPGLVLLDLRLPLVPGLDVLRGLRQQPAYKHLPVLILSSSDQDADVETAYRLGANAYIVKPPLLADLRRVASRIKQYWLDQDGPPPNCREWREITVPPPKESRREG